MSKLTLQLLNEKFSIHSLPVKSQVPESVLQAPIYFIGKTHDEISIVVPDSIKVDSEECDSNWRALEVIGPLGFTLTGIMANISTVLANAKISIFAISTFDTDYILIKDNTVKAAVKALKVNDYQVIG
jgi:uncharacterized protein